MTEPPHTTTALMPFQFHTMTVSTITDDNGNPWFVAADVCEALGLSNVSQSLTRLKSNQISDIILNDVTGREQSRKIINEAGLYKLAMRGRKKIAEEFQDWISEEVIPAIRKTGSYHAQPKAIDAYPELKAIAQLAEGVAEARMHADEAVKRAERAEAKAEVAQEIAREAVAATGRMTLEAFILGNKLLPQFPGQLDKNGRRSWPTEVARLKNYCQAYGWEILPVPVVGKSWPTENAYPMQALAWLCRHPTSVQQITLVKEQPPG